MEGKLKPRRLAGTRVKTLAVEHLGAWNHLLGEHAHGRDCRAWAYGPETEWFYPVIPEMESQIQDYIAWLNSVKLGPQIYPVHGDDLLVSLRRVKGHRRHIQWRLRCGADLRFFDATPEHLRFVNRYLGEKVWGTSVRSCHPRKRRFTNKVETRRLLHRLGHHDQVLPWVAIPFRGRDHLLIAEGVMRRIPFIWEQVVARGLNQVVDCIIIKHPELASSAGIKKVNTLQDVIEFLKLYGRFDTNELILEAGISKHRSTSMQTKITGEGYGIRGSSVQRIMVTDEAFEYRGNTMVSFGHTGLIDPCVQLQMESLADAICRELHREGVRGFAVIDYLVDEEDRVWPLEVNLRVTATVYLRSLIEQVTPRAKTSMVGVIRNVDIPKYGAVDFGDIVYRLGELLHDGVRGVMPTMLETFATSQPTICLLSTAETVDHAERLIDLAAQRLVVSPAELNLLLETKSAPRADIPFKEKVTPQGV